MKNIKIIKKIKSDTKCQPLRKVINGKGIVEKSNGLTVRE